MVLSPGETPTFRASTFHALQVSPGESPQCREPLSRPKSTPPLAIGFREPPYKPGLGKLSTRQSMSSLWSTECLLPNSQLGRVSLYGDEDSPPLSGQIRYAACRNRPTNHFINNLDQQHYFPVLWINLLPFGITLWSHPKSLTILYRIPSIRQTINIATL